jgi:hypothetical protein
MTRWYEIFNSAFWITIITILTGSLALALKYCLKSKCDHIDICFGCLKIERNVQLEQEEEMKAMELGVINESTTNLDIDSPEFKMPQRQLMR